MNHNNKACLSGLLALAALAVPGAPAVAELINEDGTRHNPATTYDIDWTLYLRTLVDTQRLAPPQQRDAPLSPADGPFRQDILNRYPGIQAVPPR